MNCLSFNGRHLIRFAKLGKTNAQLNVIRYSHTKTPVQKFGWEYLMRQEASGRPLSPHLSIYKKQLTWMLSGLYRVCGCVMGGSNYF